MVDLPAPDRPVNHSTAGFWPFSVACVSRLTSRCWRWMLSALRSAKWSMPQATVALVSLSMRMKPPSTRLGLDPSASKGSNVISRSVVTCATPIALRPRLGAARCSSVLTLISYFGCWTVAVTVWVASLSQ